MINDKSRIYISTIKTKVLQRKIKDRESSIISRQTFLNQVSVSRHKRGNFLLRFSTSRSTRGGGRLTEGMEKVWHTERQVSQLFSYRFTFVITRRVAARRMSKINGSHLELFPRTFAFFSSRSPLLSLSLSLSLVLSPLSPLVTRYPAGIYN